MAETDDDDRWVPTQSLEKCFGNSALATTLCHRDNFYQSHANEVESGRTADC